jgi:hypothetical protein
MIYYFGDSHTHGMKYQNPIPDYNYEPYPYYLSEKLGMDFKNMAAPGNNLVQNVNILIENLQYIIENGKIVMFQFQNFGNAFFRFQNEDIQWKDFVIGGDEPIDILLNRLKLTWEDAISILTYLNKFEENRSWYEMQKVYSIFNFLKTYDIKCYALFWCQPKIISIIDDKRNIILDDKKYVQDLGYTTIDDETNHIWTDGHMGNKGNELLAEKIHKFILNS